MVRTKWTFTQIQVKLRWMSVVEGWTTRYVTRLGGWVLHRFLNVDSEKPSHDGFLPDRRSNSRSSSWTRSSYLYSTTKSRLKIDLRWSDRSPSGWRHRGRNEKTIQNPRPTVSPSYLPHTRNLSSVDPSLGWWWGISTLRNPFVGGSIRSQRDRHFTPLLTIKSHPVT